MEWKPKHTTCPKCGTTYGSSVQKCPKCYGNFGMSEEVERSLNMFRKGKIGISDKQFGKCRI